MLVYTKMKSQFLCTCCKQVRVRSEILFAKGSPLTDKDNIACFKILFSQQSETRLNKLAMAEYLLP